MNRLHKTARPTAIFLIIVLLLVSQAHQSASAAGIGTETMLRVDKTTESRAYLHQILARQDVRDMLIAQGVDPQEAQDRIDSLTDEEVDGIYDQINDLAAGQGVIIFSMIILGVIIATVLIFNFTNITNVFP